jgi:polyphenol oxidase
VMETVIRPDWPVPPRVHALMTTRAFGDVKDAAVKLRLRALLPQEPSWLKQVHGTTVVRADDVAASTPNADASVTRRERAVCVVMAADCMPVLLTSDKGTVVAAAHAGWRGLCAGVLEAAFDSMKIPGKEALAWLGPAIGPRAYEVGAEVREAFLARDAAAESAFTAVRPGHWLLDLYAVARLRLRARGVERIYGGDYCTFTDKERFFSYRRDRATERMAALIWLAA